LAASPYNLVRVILGERRDANHAADNVYTRAAQHLDQWIREGILAQDSAPSFYAYFQEFAVPDSSERMTRKGFIGLGKLEDYEAGVVYRHEKTLSGPKKDRLEVLRHTRAHFGQLFMLYSDPEGQIDRELDQAASATPVFDIVDDYGVRNTLYAITQGDRIARLEESMAPAKLLIADGHHRYETALNYRREHPDDPAAQYVMMTFVNMDSPGVKILATHRILRHLDGFSTDMVLQKARNPWWAKPYDSLAALKHELGEPTPQSVRIGVVAKEGVWVLSRPRAEGELDVPVLHHEILSGWLGIDEEAVREERNISYIRGIDAAMAEVREHGAQAAFLMEPTPIHDMARIAFSGGVMPQKSTDFYPKLLSGATIYHL